MAVPTEDQRAQTPLLMALCDGDRITIRGRNKYADSDFNTAWDVFERSGNFSPTEPITDIKTYTTVPVTLTLELDAPVSPALGQRVLVAGLVIDTYTQGTNTAPGKIRLRVTATLEDGTTYTQDLTVKTRCMGNSTFILMFSKETAGGSYAALAVIDNGSSIGATTTDVQVLATVTTITVEVLQAPPSTSVEADTLSIISDEWELARAAMQAGSR